MFSFFKVLAVLFGFEYALSSYLVEKGLKKINLVLPDETVKIVKDRVFRMKFELRLLINFLIFITGLYALPMQLRIWDLEWQLFLERLFNPIFQFLAFCQGFVEGTLFGVLIAIAFWIAINWFENQKAKFYIFYLIYKYRAR